MCFGAQSFAIHCIFLCVNLIPKEDTLFPNDKRFVFRSDALYNLYEEI